MVSHWTMPCCQAVCEVWGCSYPLHLPPALPHEEGPSPCGAHPGCFLGTAGHTDSGPASGVHEKEQRES